MGSTGGVLPPEDIISGLRKILTRLNQYKNSVCMGLALAKQNIDSWYTALDEVVSAQIILDRIDPGTKTISCDGADKLRLFLNERRYATAAEESLDFLKRIPRQYPDPPYRRVALSQDISEIPELGRLISVFLESAAGKNSRYIFDHLAPDTLATERALILQLWIENLASDREKICNIVWEIRELIGCE